MRFTLPSQTHLLKDGKEDRTGTTERSKQVPKFGDVWTSFSQQIDRASPQTGMLGHIVGRLAERFVW